MVHKPLKPINPPPYKNASGMWYTQALFLERMRERPLSEWRFEPPFTLFVDFPGKVNARKTFVELGDPSGYSWAIKYLGDWNHWLILMKKPWFKEAYDEWVAELNLRVKSEALARIYEIMQSENQTQALAAAKFLAQEEQTKKRGRPTKAEVTGELKRAAEALETEDEDLARIGLKVIQGGKSGNGG